MDKVAAIYDDYDDVLKIYGDEVKKRFADLLSSYTDFIIATELDGKVAVSKTSLMNAVLDYFSDIIRLKRFHQIENTNKYKIFAYEISWLLKRKILQILDENDDSLVFINEKFLLSYTLNFIENEFPFYYDSNSNKSLTDRFDGFVESYYYYLKYRNCDPKALEIIFMAIDAGYTIRQLEETTKDWETNPQPFVVLSGIL